MRDHLIAAMDLSAGLAAQAVELFIVNAKHVGIMRPVSGTERVLTIEHVLDEQPAVRHTPPATDNGAAGARTSPPSRSATGDFEHICFYVTPIGDEDSEPRKHADVFLGHLVEPAVEALDLGLRVVRADHNEGRTYRGLHHHLTCVTVAHAFLTCCRLQRAGPDAARPQTAAA